MSLKTKAEMLIKTVNKDMIIKKIEVNTWHQSEENECYNNVNNYIEHHQGKIFYGWILWHQEKLLELEAHAVWESPNGELICISPHKNKEKFIFFVEDKSNTVNGNIVDNIRIALDDNDEFTKRYIQVLECKYKLNMIIFEQMQKNKICKDKLKKGQINYKEKNVLIDGKIFTGTIYKLFYYTDQIRKAEYNIKSHTEKGLLLKEINGFIKNLKN